ncbi:major capsid protein [Streptomyces javensis]|uniref:Major capsid protein n=1 Tax=Streptomyces javensis TaxID=114698 RepID=A0ABS0R6M3_9ACTN|nr:major capsid protein [Streptomyces javensis]MBI0313024.1 major capsid protein [Streptomyces javensis]
MPTEIHDMLELLLRELTPTDINAFVRAIPGPEDYELTRSVLPEVRLNTVKWRVKRTNRRVPAAKYRAWDATTPVATREITMVETEGKLPPLGQKYLVGEMEQLLLDADRGANSDELVQAVYDDVAAHVLSIRSRMELAAGDLLADGKFTLKGENNLYIEYDAQVPAAHMPTAAVPWTDPTADALADEMRWIQALRDARAPLPTRIFTSFKAKSLLAGNQSYRAAYYGSLLGSQIPTAVLAPNEVDVVRARYGLPPITVYDVQIPLDDGTNPRALPENLWLMLPPNPRQWGETQYGVTAESLVLSRGTNPAILREDAPGIVVTHGYTDDPVTVWTKVAASAMPVMYVPDIHIAARVW